MCINRLCLSIHCNFSWLKWYIETVFHLRHSSALQSFKLVFKMHTGSRAWTVLIIRHDQNRKCFHLLLLSSSFIFLREEGMRMLWIFFSYYLFLFLHLISVFLCRKTALGVVSVGLVSCFCYGGWMGKFLSFPISRQTELNILGLWMKVWWAMTTSVQMCAHLVCSVSILARKSMPLNF